MADMTPERIRGERPPKRTAKSVAGTIIGAACAVLAGTAAAYAVSPEFRTAVDMAVAAMSGE